MFKEFSEEWDRSDAVIALFVGWDVLAQNGNMGARLSMSIQEAFEGRSARLDHDQDLVQYGKTRAVGLAVKKVAARMKELKLSDGCQMPAVLWIRLATESGLGIEPDTVRRFGAWTLENGMATLMKCKNRRVSAAWENPELKISGWTASGYTLVELLLAKNNADARWPYHVEWEAADAAVPSTISAAATSLLGNAADGETVADEPEVPTKTKAKRKRRKSPEPVDKLIKRYGRPIMDELKKCLQRESTAPNSLLTKIQRKDGRYDCIHSRETLVRELKGRYKSLDWALSSLIRVAPAFVACPPGNRGYEAAPPPKPRKPREL